MSTRRFTAVGADVESTYDARRRFEAVGADVETRIIKTRRVSAVAVMIETVPLLPPVADFVGTPLVGDEPLTVAFTDLSINTPISWLWDFGDGSFSHLNNPNHTYAADGVYTVTLTASNYNGDDTETKVDYVVVSIFVPVPIVRIIHFTGADTPDTPKFS